MFTILLLFAAISTTNAMLITSRQVNSEVTTSCRNNRCETCVDKLCFPRSFASMRFTRNCPVAACEYGCSGFVVYTDGCPMCSCPDETGTRELCRSAGECGHGAACKNYLCRYSNVSKSLPAVCDFDHECAEDDQCLGGKCAAGAPMRHLTNHSCVFLHECPRKHFCKNMTCYKNLALPDHLQNKPCVFRHECPNGTFCKDMTCVSDSADDKVEHIAGRSCVFESDCPEDFGCRGMTCVKESASSKDSYSDLEDDE